MGGRGGAHGSGKVSYPEYLQSTQSWLMFNRYPSSGSAWDGKIGGESSAISFSLLGDIRTARTNAGINPYTPYDDVTESGNPNATAYDPDSELNAVQERFAVFDTHLLSLNERTDWGGFVDQSLARVQTDTEFVPADISASVESIVSASIQAASQAVNLSLSDVWTAVDQAVEKAVQILGPIVSDIPERAEELLRPMIEGIVARTEGLAPLIRNASTRAAQNVQDLTDTASRTTQAIWEPIIDAIWERASKKLATVPTEALSAAMAALNADRIDTVVDSYEKRQRKSFYRSVNRFTAGMADINAVQNSQFLLGLALIESEYMADIADFDAKIRLQTFGDSFRGYLQIHAQQIESQYRLHSEAIGQQIQATISHLGQQIEFHARDIAEQYQLYGGNALEQFRSRAQTIAQQIEIVDRQSQAQIEAFRDVFRSHLEAHSRSFLTDRAFRHQFVSESVREMTQMLSGRMQLHANASQILNEINRQQIIQKREENERNQELTVKEALWDLELYDYALKGIASVSGGSPSGSMKEPSRFQSALSGAMSGAAAGGALMYASSGPVGWGVGIGAALGGALGLF